MNEAATSRQGRNAVDQAVELSATGAAERVKLPPSHNWCTVVASSADNTDTGNVVAILVSGSPRSGNTAQGAIGTMALATYGVSETFHVPPGAQLSFFLDNFAGTGPVTAVVSSWSEC